MMRASLDETRWNTLARIGLSLLLSVQFLALGALPATAAPKAVPWSFWAANDPAGQVRVDHSPWDRFLKKYVVTKHPSGINRIRYASVTPEDRKALDDYLQRLQGVEVTRLNRSEQKAYWINLYNALTVKVVLDHYPVKSIRDIDISPGLFSRGPWGAKLLTIQGQKVSLEEVRSLLDEAEAAGVRDVVFTGGEPFLHPDMAEIAGDTLRRFPATILTNGTLLTDRIVEPFVSTVETGWWTTCLEILPAKERARGMH